MKFIDIYFDDLSVNIKVNLFAGQNEHSEAHAIVKITDRALTDREQFANIETAITRLTTNRLNGFSLIWKRYFVSDAANQSMLIDKKDNTAAISLVQQPPLDGSKTAVWLYLIAGENNIFKDNNTLVVQRNTNLKHLYTTQLNHPLKNEYDETISIFNSYTSTLSQFNSTLKENCVRTWLYVQGVDIHYQGMVKARNAIFEKEGLTKDSHYIASTGIEGRHSNPQALVLMDAYAVEGLQQEQIKFLYASTHLNRTHDYGVSFERATAIDFADRRHIYVSGTASIDNKGEIVYPNDIMKQLQRMIENIEALLSEAESSITDVAKMIIYLRDMADYKRVSEYINVHYPEIPSIIVLAPVCRPGWLIETECIAIKPIVKKDLPEF